MIVFDCPNCGKHYSFSDRFAGRKMSCNQCKSDLVVPEAENEPGPVPLPPVDKPPVPSFSDPPAERSELHPDEVSMPVPPPIPPTLLPNDISEQGDAPFSCDILTAPVLPADAASSAPIPPPLPPDDSFAAPAPPPLPGYSEAPILPSPPASLTPENASSFHADTDSAILAYVFEEKVRDRNQPAAAAGPVLAESPPVVSDTRSEQKKALIYWGSIVLMLSAVLGTGLYLALGVDWRESDPRPALLERLETRKNQAFIEAKQKESESETLRLQALHGWNRTNESIDSVIMTLGELDNRRLDMRDMEQMLGSVGNDEERRRQLVPKRDEIGMVLRTTEDRLKTLRAQTEAGIQKATDEENNADTAEHDAALLREEAGFYEKQESDLRDKIARFPNERSAAAMPSFEPSRRRTVEDSVARFDTDWTENHFRLFAFSGASPERFVAAFDAVRRLYGDKALRLTSFEKTPQTIVFPAERNARADLGAARFMVFALRFPDYRDPIQIGNDPDLGKPGEIGFRFGNTAGYVEFRTISPRYCEALFYEGRGKFVVVEFPFEGDSFWRRTDRFDMDRFQAAAGDIDAALAGPVTSGSEPAGTPPTFFSSIDWIEIRVTPLTDRTTFWIDGMKTETEKSQSPFDLLQIENLQQSQRKREKDFFEQRRKAVKKHTAVPVAPASSPGGGVEFIDPEDDGQERPAPDGSRQPPNSTSIPSNIEETPPEFAGTEEERTRQLVRWVLQTAGGRMRLQLGNRTISLGSKSPIPDSLSGAAIEEIDLAGFRNWDENRLDRIGERKELKHLNLSRTGLKNHDIIKLAALGSLESLNLAGNELSFESLPALRSLKNLRELNLDGINAAPQGFEALGSLVNLENLNLARSAIGSTDMNFLLPLNQLKTLDLSSTKIGNRALELLRPHSSLESLNLSRTRISDQGPVSLSTLRNLRRLQLDGTSLTDACLRDIAKIPNLETISVKNTSISKGGVREALGASWIAKFSFSN